VKPSPKRKVSDDDEERLGPKVKVAQSAPKRKVSDDEEERPAAKAKAPQSGPIRAKKVSDDEDLGGPKPAPAVQVEAKPKTQGLVLRGAKPAPKAAGGVQGRQAQKPVVQKISNWDDVDWDEAEDDDDVK
jgi:hypothetical protein